jgi:tripartite-type tricarboxylate transporter receptor subunit TctC
MKRIFKTLCAVVITTSAFASAAIAQDVYPSKAIKLIVPLGAGGATDVVARVVAAKLSQRLGQQVIVENRPGAEGVIGVNAGAKADPDGYTLVLGSSTTLAANFHLRKSLPFHPINDLAPVSMALKDFYNVLVINPNVPAKNLKEFIAYAKANPGKLNYGTATVGSKICMEMFRTMAGIDLKMINYKSSPQALNAASDRVRTRCNLCAQYQSR